jgi:hypothetical protein
MGVFSKIFGGRKKGIEYDERNYLVYCIIGKAGRDRDKLQYLNQWMQCYRLLDDYLMDCATKSVSSEQVFCKIPGVGSDGVPRLNHRGAPTGGLMKWSEKNNRKICEAHLTAQLADIEAALAEGLPLQEWVVAHYPERDTYVDFIGHKVLGRMEAVNELNRNGYNDFIFRLGHSSDVARGFSANQEVNIFISERFAASRGLSGTDVFIRGVAQLAQSVLAGVTQMPLSRCEYRDDIYGGKSVTSFIGRDYGAHDGNSLAFEPNPAGKEWKIIGTGTRV